MKCKKGYKPKNGKCVKVQKNMGVDFRMKPKWKGALIGGIVGILVGFLVFIGISFFVPNKGSLPFAIFAFVLSVVFFIFLGFVFDLIYKKHKKVVLFGILGVIAQTLIFLLNPSSNNLFLYWIFFPGVPIIIGILIGIILEVIKHEK